MRVASLQLSNVRAIETAEFRFSPGFNLIAGVNGVGKTIVLDTLAVCLSGIIGHVNQLRRYGIQFLLDDIRVGADALDVFCDIDDGNGAQFNYVFHWSRETSTMQESAAVSPCKMANDSLEWNGFSRGAPPFATGMEPDGRPIAILFSTNRAVPFEKAPAKSAVSGGTDVAFSGALSSRKLCLGEFAAWMRVRQALSEKCPAAGRVLEAFQNAVTRFLPGYRNLRPGELGKRGRSLLIDYGGGTTLPVKLLSGGERGVLAMVLDLTRRLALANPKMEDPAADAEAIVLIDEIELHLHPACQRRVVRNLTKTFPKCQFIATTQSPQVIGEVENDRVQIIADGRVYSPSHSFGVDSSRVLEEIMGAEARTKEVQVLLDGISRRIGDNQYDDANAQLISLTRRLGENDPEVTRIRTLLDFMADDE